MINTHYFYRPLKLNAEQFAAFVGDVNRVVQQLPAGLSLRGPDGIGPAEITPHRIALNGDRAGGEDHEPLVIEETYSRRPPSRARNGIHFDFCKTHGKPYDLAVVAVLYAFIYHFPDTRFTSDSTAEELKPGFDLFVDACKPHCDLQVLQARPISDRE